MNSPTRSDVKSHFQRDDGEDLIFEPQAPKPRPSKEEAARIAQEAGFLDAPKTTEAKPQPRNAQLNLKARQETIDRLKQLAAELGVPMAEVLERALDAFEKARR